MKPWFLIKSGYYIVPSSSTALTKHKTLPNKKFFKTGGNDNYGHLSETSSNSTEYILPNGQSVDGPVLPTPLKRHAMVNINSTHTFFIGGKTPDSWKR